MVSITKTCAVSGKQFVIDDVDQQFYAQMAPQFGDQTFELPVPTLCPEERQRRRLAWQNMYHLYWRKCDATTQKILSSISPDKPHTVYAQEYWWSDAWNAYDYGLEPDFSKPFFEQLDPLLKTVPYPAMFTNYLDDENSGFTNFAGFDKDCYLIFHADMNRECLYGTGVKKCQNAVDIFNAFDCELVYECVDCRNCYNLKYSQDCENCSDSWFLKDCIGCKNCFGCINLRQSEYCLFNKKVTKAEYETFIHSFDSGSYQAIEKLRTQFAEFQANQPHRATQGYQNENCTGDHIFRSRDVRDSFDVQESRDMRYCERIYNGPNSDCYDLDQFGMKVQQCYEGGPIGQDSVNVIAAAMVYNATDAAYLAFSFHSQDCFGCIGLNKGKNALLNKAYTKHEYEAVRDKMIAHMKETSEWGEFFPISLSPWAYNETIAQEYYPLDQIRAQKRGYQWKEDLEKDTAVDTTGKDQNVIPDNLSEIDATICNQVLHCAQTGKPYKIQPAELQFYQKMKLPLPRIHPDQRHKNRNTQRPARQLKPVNCNTCQKTIETTLDRTKILCESCYQDVVQ